jgi:hypothetical protein
MTILVTKECSIPAMNTVEVAGRPSGLPRTVSVSISSEINHSEFPATPFFPGQYQQTLTLSTRSQKSFNIQGQLYEKRVMNP